MDSRIHQTAIVDHAADIGSGVEIGPYSIIEAGVKIGDGCSIASHAVIASGTELGSGCRIFKGAVLGTIPQDLKFHGEETKLIVGERTVLREYCTLNRGTKEGGSLTRVGSDCLIMAYAHVAHDCRVGNHVILANGLTMAGHVTIEDYVGVSGLVLIHQYVRIGTYAYIGGGSRIPQDVPPYVLLNGDPARYFGVNSVGLQRTGFTDEQIAAIKRAYKYIFRSKMNLTQAVEAIRSDLEETEEIKIILDFIEKSERGLAGR